MAINALINDGVVVVAAAGNDEYDLDDPRNAEYPASYSQLITVGGVSSNDREGEYNIGSVIDLFAPGGNMESSSHKLLAAGIGSPTDTMRAQGTSYAAPHVSGVAARDLEGFMGVPPRRWPRQQARQSECTT